MTENDSKDGKAEVKDGGPRGGIRAADVASAEAYAKDGIFGAPGSEVDGARTPVTRDYSGDTDNRPATQIEAEQLAADADVAAAGDDG